MVPDALVIFHFATFSLRQCLLPVDLLSPLAEKMSFYSICSMHNIMIIFLLKRHFDTFSVIRVVNYVYNLLLFVLLLNCDMIILQRVNVNKSD